MKEKIAKKLFTMRNDLIEKHGERKGNLEFHRELLLLAEEHRENELGDVFLTLAALAAEHFCPEMVS